MRLTHACIALGLTGLPALVTTSAARADEVQTYQGMAVSVVKAERQCFKDVLQVTGVFVPKSEIQLRPDRDGMKVSQVLIEPGDSVGAGQVLARLVLQQADASPQNVPLRSPVSGIAVGISAVVGSYASPSAPDPMFRIIVDGELELKGEVLAADMLRVHVNQPATVQIQGIGQLTGQVTSIDNTIDAISQLGSIRVSVASDPRLRSGVFARANIDAGETCGVAVPLSAVLYGPEGAVVQVVRNDHVETRRVEMGVLRKGTALVKDGLDEADVVIARAGGFLREGDRVRPYPLDTTATP